MEALHVSDVEQPVLQQAVVHVFHRRPDAPTTVVPADYDVRHLREGRGKAGEGGDMNSYHRVAVAQTSPSSKARHTECEYKFSFANGNVLGLQRELHSTSLENRSRIIDRCGK